MKLFDADASRAALPFDRLIPALRTLFAEGCTVPPRHVHQLDGGTTLIMPAWTSQYLGIKTVNIFPDNAARGLPGLFSTYMLYDAATGAPLANIDGNEITERRTAAASALAASFLARPDARKLLIVGSGRVAKVLVAAYRAILRIEEVAVWSRNGDAATALAASLRQDGIAATAWPELESAVRQADIVSCATLSTSPLIRGEWLAPGSHLDLIGGFTPQMVEADDACFKGAHLFVDTEEALQKAGDLLGPISRGVFAPGDVAATLAMLCRGEHPGRRNAAERTVFKSVGTALEDLAAAMLVLHSS